MRKIETTPRDERCKVVDFNADPAVKKFPADLALLFAPEL
jgi:hypothetical protein